MAIKSLYISDLDGTLLNSSKEISGYARKTINRLIENGVYFSVATARTAVSSTKMLAGLHINIPIILMNGAAIYDIAAGKYIKTETIPPEIADAILQVIRKHQITGFMYAISDNKLHAYYELLNTPALRDYYDERVTQYAKPFEQVDCFSSKITDNEIVYFTLMDTQERLANMVGDIKKLQGIDMVLSHDVYVENLWFLEIYGPNASKYNAVNYIRDYCGFNRIIGFGDNINDLPLLNACDEFYAVANALHVIKEKATGVIGDNNSDAVAKYIAEKEA
ncbi:MAG TPA: Cof-type HAD-IIB family hydrolase [Methylomusa anaerophila]|uniref:Pyridoxal phosphate phosphatase YbhA n=1 Tax=Methylomusa anaerophila TaxID=1930071 RepID=A0A348AEI6_9FIRM|nr:Cof-type HAD-IIB family hydrolase [Methylomusa anaerophila]BBB89484.1 pyridoxal phosphate phosphatase YbhA [Methylomusa anaerophila]HML89715.1 Cof-type HAD-IIB family hydrolase [Methylomusa anaerophila]